MSRTSLDLIDADAQETAADAYRHAAEMAAAVAEKARREQRPEPTVPVFVRVEYVEHLAAELTARAEEAGNDQ